MLKKAVQQGRSERRGEGVRFGTVSPSERDENAAGGLFQHPARIPDLFLQDGAQLVILLGGSTKQRQQQAIETAIERWADYKRRKSSKKA